VTAGLFTLGAYLAHNLSGGWGVGFWIASLGCLLAMNLAVRQSEQLTLGLPFGFGVLLIFVSIPAGSVVYALLGLVIFAGLVMIDFQRLRVSTHSTARRCWRPRSSWTSSTSSSSSSRCSAGPAGDRSYQATDAVSDQPSPPRRLS
jgi:hypothetical protein